MTRATRRHSDWRDIIATALRLLGWVCVNALVAAGCFTFAALLMGGGTGAGTMMQLANLADHYGRADVVRRDQFDQFVIIGYFGLFLTVAVLRRGRFIKACIENGASRD